MPSVQPIFLSCDTDLDLIARDRFAAAFATVTHGVRRVDALPDSTVTIVLLGRRTWALAHVDAEIRASLRQTTGRERSGLLGVLLPAYEPLADRHAVRMASDPGRATWCHGNVPEALWRNVATGFASIRPYPRGPEELTAWVRDAWLRRHGSAVADEGGAPLVTDYPRESNAWTEVRRDPS